MMSVRKLMRAMRIPRAATAGSDDIPVLQPKHARPASQNMKTQITAAERRPRLNPPALASHFSASTAASLERKISPEASAVAGAQAMSPRKPRPKYQNMRQNPINPMTTNGRSMTV